MKKNISTTIVFAAILLALLLVASGWAAKSSTPASSNNIQVDQGRQLSEQAQAKDPKYRSSNKCPDLAVITVTVTEGSSGISARARVKNMCSRESGEARVLFTGPGEPGVTQGIGKVAPNAVRATGNIMVSVDPTRRPITIRATVKVSGDKNSANNSKTARLD